MALATTPAFHEDLLSTIKSWPPIIYSAMPVIAVIEPQLDSSSMTDELKEVNVIDDEIIRYVVTHSFDNLFQLC